MLIDLLSKLLAGKGSDFDSQQDSSAFFFDIPMLFKFHFVSSSSIDGLRLLGKFELCQEIASGALSGYMRKSYLILVTEIDERLFVFDVKYKAFDSQFGVKS